MDAYSMLYFLLKFLEKITYLLMISLKDYTHTNSDLHAQNCLPLLLEVSIKMF